MQLSAYIHIVYATLAAAAGYGYFRDKGNTVAEAGAYGLMAMLMLHSWTSQTALIVGWQRFHHFGLALIGIPAAWIIGVHMGALKSLLHAVRRFAGRNWLPCGALAGIWVTLAALNVSRMGLFRAAGAAGGHSVLAAGGGSIFAKACSAGAPALAVLNHLVIAAPFQPAAAVIIANLSAWLVIALGTYALARRYTWPATAATVALLVVCIPRVLQQSTASNSELLPAAAVLLSLLAMYRGIEQPQAHDLVMLPAAVAFSVSGGRLCYLMPAVLAGLSLTVLRRRHPARHWPRALTAHRGAVLAALGAVLIFSQVGNVTLNLANGKSWIGTPPLEEVAFNMDGIGGALANAGRYLFQAVHFPEGVDRIWNHVLGFSPRGSIEAVYRNTLGALFGGRGAAAPFLLSWAARDPWGWFGPAGFFLILPALAYALRRAPRRLKSTAAAMAAYFLAIALILAWRPQNVRLMTIFFVGSGFIVAFFLPPWRISRRGRLALQLFSMAVAADTLMYL